MISITRSGFSPSSSLSTHSHPHQVKGHQPHVTAKKQTNQHLGTGSGVLCGFGREVDPLQSLRVILSLEGPGGLGLLVSQTYLHSTWDTMGTKGEDETRDWYSMYIDCSIIRRCERLRGHIWLERNSPDWFVARLWDGGVLLLLMWFMSGFEAHHLFISNLWWSSGICLIES